MPYKNRKIKIFFDDAEPKVGIFEDSKITIKQIKEKFHIAESKLIAMATPGGAKLLDNNDTISLDKDVVLKVAPNVQYGFSN